MSTTLTNGLKLPDKGSVDWYADMQNNYQILDGAVGTIAEHTSALSGKAPLVHTHTKSDVTDLFNSANTWSGQNTFSNHLYIYGQWKGLYFKNPEVTAGTAPSGDKRSYISFTDSNDYVLGSITLNVTGANSTWLQTGISAKDVNDSSQSIYCGTQYRVYGNGEKYFVPATNGDIYFGTSTLQWKSVYAQSYYYNGTAWGLDKANTWSGWNQFNNLSLYSNDVTYNQAPSSNIELPSIRITGGGRYCGAFDYIWKSTGENIIRLSLGSYTSAGVFGYWACNFGVPRDFSNGGKFGTPAFYPNNSGGYNLGTSTFKWKTLNGINPGALSLPNYNASIAQDISGDMVPDQYGRNIRFTPTMDGWMYVDFNISNATLLSGSQEMLVQVKDSNIANANFVVNFAASIGSSHIFVYLPVLKERSVILEINFTGFSIGKGYVYPCQGTILNS